MKNWDYLASSDHPQENYPILAILTHNIRGLIFSYTESPNFYKLYEHLLFTYIIHQCELEKNSKTKVIISPFVFAQNEFLDLGI